MKQNLINIIARCNVQEIKDKWIIDLATKTDYECNESECLGCKIEKDCLRVLQGGIDNE